MCKQGGRIFVFILAIIIAGFFYTQRALADQHILISQAQISGGPGRTGHDFIEIYNPTDAGFNLKGYRLVKRTKTGATDINIKSWTADTVIPPSGYYLWANSGYTDISVAPNAATTATISDDNGIAIRLGAADTGAIIDSLAWGEAQNVFIEGAVFPINPGANQSLERNLNSDTDNNSADFSIQTNPHPQSSSLAPPPAEQPANPPAEELASDQTASSTDSNPPNSPASPRPPRFAGDTGGSAGQALYQGGDKVNLGDVVINELVSDPADNEVEWLELYNKTAKEIDLSGWWLEDGSSAKTKLAGSIGLSGSGRYKIIEKPAGVLNNEGDLIILYEAGGKIIDQIAYGNWNDGQAADNAPVARDPLSLARKFDGYNTFNQANDWAATFKPTKGASNLIQAEDEVSLEAKAKFDFTSHIFISEILPNPTGDDTKQEFIEIYNAGEREVNLTGWSLSDEDGKKVNLEKIALSAIIKAGEYLALFRPKTKIVLHNDQGEVRLFKPLADQPARIVKYKEVKEGWSYNLNNPSNPPAASAGQALYQGGFIQDGANQAGDWLWSETPTPGAVNVWLTINRAPAVEFSWPKEALIGQPVRFDSSDTDDPDGDSLEYAWDFGDGFKNNLVNPEHTFFKSGIYKIKLAVSDGQATSTKEKNLKAVKNVGELDSLEIDADEEKLQNPLNPPAASAGQALYQGGTIIINEIFPNPAGADTGREWAEFKNLGPDEVNLINWRLENQNGKYKFKNYPRLEAGHFYLLTSPESKLAFKNESDVISLYNDLDELIDRVEYNKAVQGESYARGANGKWFWTAKVTPREENIISLSGSQSAVLAKASGAAGNTLNYIETTLEKIRELEIGSLVRVKGLVAVEPGILGVQIFYIAGSPSFALAMDNKATAGEAGVQIYNYKKDFPSLKTGDYIEVNGELAETQAELRIKTKDKNDIYIVERRAPPLALALSCDAISEENIGQLITLTGEITDKKAYTAYLDDGQAEILIYFKQSAGLDTKSLKAGEIAAITGILSKTPTGLRLLPRYQTDIVKIDSAGAAPQVLGETAQSEDWAVAERDKKLELLKYLLIIAGGIIIVLSGLFIKTVWRRPTKF